MTSDGTPTRIRDDGDLRRYRTEIPNCIDDADLSVYAFRLYVHLKRVAGDEGTCWQSTRTLAEACKMSLAKVVDAKRELEAAGLIEIGKHATRSGPGDTITIVDVWSENFSRYGKRSPHEQSVRHTNAKRSPREQEEEPSEEVTHEEEECAAQTPPLTLEVQEPETPKAKGKKRKELTDDDRCKAYKDVFGFWPNTTQRQEIVRKVLDLERWRAACEAWDYMGKGSPRNVPGILDYYRKGMTVAQLDAENRRNGATGPPADEPTDGRRFIPGTGWLEAKR